MRLESAGWLPTVTPRTYTCRRWDSNLVQWRQRQGLSGSMAASCLHPQSLLNVRETRTEGRHAGTQLETGPQGDSKCSHSEHFCKCQWKHQSVDWKLQANSSEEANPQIWSLWMMRLNGSYRVVLHHQNDRSFGAGLLTRGRGPDWGCAPGRPQRSPARFHFCLQSPACLPHRHSLTPALHTCYILMTLVGTGPV